MKLVAVGDVGVDRYMPENNLLPGGITANFARQANSCFVKEDEIHVVSILGDNYPETDIAFNAVNVSGIKCHINRVAGNTPVQYIEVQKDGERNFTEYDPGVLEHFFLDDEQKAVMSSADVIMTPVYWQIKNVFDIVMAVKTNASIAVDFSDFATDPDFNLFERYLDKINFAFFGLTAEQQDLIDRLSAYATRQNLTIIITLGENGSIAYRNGQKYRCNAVPVRKVVDTTGAGDAFAAGFLSLHGIGCLEECLSSGAHRAALTIEQIGSVPT